MGKMTAQFSWMLLLIVGWTVPVDVGVFSTTLVKYQALSSHAVKLQLLIVFIWNCFCKIRRYIGILISTLIVD